jgi:hypothetical protein
MTKEQDSKPEDSAASDQKPKLKVTDRRMFDANGNPRQPDIDESAVDRDESAAATERSAVSEPAAAEPPAAEAEATAPPPEVAASAAESDATPAEPAATATEPEAAGPADSEGGQAAGASFADLPRDFSAFVESQYLEALIFLGAVPHPQTGETIEDPAFASYKIDLLAMLQEKTEGNLTEEEARLIEDVLYQLRMLYVQKTQGIQT